jgi:hypothetical protein
MGAPCGDRAVAETRPPVSIGGRSNAITAASSAAWRTINFSVSADCGARRSAPPIAAAASTQTNELPEDVALCCPQKF